MKVKITLFVLFIVSCLVSVSYGTVTKASGEKRILVVSSYHKEYLWSQDTSRGFCAAMLQFGYFDNNDQIKEYTKNDYVESSRAVVKKLWMDTKRKSDKNGITEATVNIAKIARDFKPDLIFLGDDNAAKYIGNLFLDSEIPVVFWGVNNTPVKYGLVDSAEKPGHNVTGVYQTGYYIESLEFLKAIVPDIKTFAILSTKNSTGRSHLKKITFLAEQGKLPVKLIEAVSTNDFEAWKQKALALQKKVDAFYVPHYSGLQDKAGHYVPTEEVAAWYVNNVKIPEASLGVMVGQGLLCTANDSGYNQGFEAVVIAHDILANGKNPATYIPRTPKRGLLIVNRQRAKTLGITLTEDMGIEKYIDSVMASKETKKRILVISSYHREYLWSQDTNQGVIKAFLDFKYMDNEKQAEDFTENDYINSSTAVIKKLWMDTKRKNSKREIALTLSKIIQEIEKFKPDILLLGDDNATNYIGKQYIDTEIPIVFWGVNGLPLKYGLLDTLDKPGHNVTGIYQAGYLKETVEYLKKFVPDIKTFAILSDDSPTGRSKAKELNRLAENGEIPVRLVETVVTNSLSEWKSKALDLQQKVDAFFILNHNTIKDEQGNPVDQLEIGKWYLNNIKKPDASHEKQFVEEGILCAVDDSGFKQGYEAAKMAYQILGKGKDPADMPSYAPDKGPFIVNRERAAMLGLEHRLKDSTFIEKYVEKALALEY